MSIITRFAPSPTGTLHIGGARTALFNWLFARHHQGKFLLRIEDTDRERSTPEATETILESLTWLGLDWDDEPVYQSTRADRHREVANLLLESGNAYRCYMTPQEIAIARQAASSRKTQYRLQSPWRDFSGTSPDTPYAIRLKTPTQGTTTIQDIVQSTVSWKNQDLEDLVLVRSDGTPTYMLAVVADDHDMGITDIIRGDDHLTNAAKQSLIYDALSWDRPVFTHIPLIHGPDGKKYTKRQGAVGVQEFAEQGYLPDAMRNYLARLGWAHGDHEIFTTEQAQKWFTLEAIGKSAARMDPDKLLHTNAVYLRNMEINTAMDTLETYLYKHKHVVLTDGMKKKVLSTLDQVTVRTRTLEEVANMIRFIIDAKHHAPEALVNKYLKDEHLHILEDLLPTLENNQDWSKDNLERLVRDFLDRQKITLGNLAKPLRVALTSSNISPGIFDVMWVLGKEQTVKSIQAVLAERT